MQLHNQMLLDLSYNVSPWPLLLPKYLHLSCYPDRAMIDTNSAEIYVGI